MVCGLSRVYYSGGRSYALMVLGEYCGRSFERGLEMFAIFMVAEVFRVIVRGLVEFNGVLVSVD